MTLKLFPHESWRDETDHFGRPVNRTDLTANRKKSKGLDSREWKRLAARSQKTKVKTIKTNKGFI